MRDVVVVGAGKIGSTIADMLASSGDWRVTVADRSREQLDRLEAGASVERAEVDVEDGRRLTQLLSGRYAVLSAAPFNLTIRVAEAARAAGANYLDLTEDVATTRRVKELARGADTAFVPQCGLAPGFISIVAADLGRRFDTIDTLRLSHVTPLAAPLFLEVGKVPVNGAAEERLLKEETERLMHIAGLA